MLKRLDFDINIDEKGVGRSIIKNAEKGYIKLIVLPNKLVSTEFQVIQPNLANMLVSLSKEDRIFRPKMDCVDMKGVRIQDMEDIPFFDDDIVLTVNRGIPNTVFRATIIIDVKTGVKI